MKKARAKRPLKKKAVRGAPAAAKETQPPARDPRQDELIKCLEPFVEEISGPKGVKIVDCIGDGTTDETIEEQTSLKIAEIRSLLNHLHSYGVVEYTREKNMTSGWFTYTWKVNADRALQNFLVMKQREYTELKKQYATAENAFIYACRSKCAKLAFDVALESQFRCPSCKGMLKEINVSDEMGELDKKITALKSIHASFSQRSIGVSKNQGLLDSQKLIKPLLENRTKPLTSYKRL
ncbi:hypothetical protein H0O03_01015 [Candidatus Micrarchaeota archaeon]|nr:hypothetical protein [Candidatus Micrarchaeota archaeon]